MIKNFFIFLFNANEKHPWIYWLVFMLLTGPLSFILMFSSDYVYPNHTSVFYVNDYSHVLTESSERYIAEQARILDDKTKAQVVVVTVPDTRDDSLEQYSLKLANQWGIGDKDLDNGILILFTTAPDNKHVRLEVGKGLEGGIPDAKAGRILDDYAVEPKKKGEWNKAAVNTFVAVLSELYKIYDIKPGDNLKFITEEVPAEADKVTMADAPFEKSGSANEEDKAGWEGNAIFVLVTLLINSFGYLIFICIIATIVESVSPETYRGSSFAKRDKEYGGRSSSGNSEHRYRSSGGGHHRSGGGGHFGGGGASR